MMRAISAVCVGVVLAACGSGDSGGGASGKDAGRDPEGLVLGDAQVDLEADASLVEHDAAEGPDAADLDAAELDAAQSEVLDSDAGGDAELADGQVPDTSVADSSVPPTADQLLEAQVTAKMRECKVIGATGDYKANKVVDSYDRCLSQCYIASACPVLLDVFCKGTDIPAALGACLKACSDAPIGDGFACASGTQKIPHLFVCDGVTADCTGNTCDFPGCYDESEEVGCTQTISCVHEGEQTNLLSYFVCDGYVDCDDGKDEVGCASACPGG